MKSRITIDFKGVDAPEGPSRFEPVIRVSVEDSEDVRDGLVKALFESLGGISSWLSVDIHYNTEYGKTKQNITLTPITPDEITSTITSMVNRTTENPIEWYKEQIKLLEADKYLESIMESK